MKVKVKSLSRVRLLATPWAAAYQALLSMGFSRQEYWSGVPLPSPLCNLESPYTKTGNIETRLFNEKTLRNFELEHDTLGQGQRFPGSAGSITC